MQHFIDKSGASISNPVLLIIDNAECHMSVEAIDLAKRNGVIMLTLPPHSSNKLQPLDRTVFSSFKKYYSEALINVLARTGQPLSIYEVAECVAYAHDLAFTAKNIKKGFQLCGIFPFDKNVFNEAEFLPSTVTSTKNKCD
jgi:hypothetical protein